MARVLAIVALLFLLACPVAEAKVKLTPEQRVNRLWQRVKPHYGGGSLPPVHFGKVPTKGAAAVTTDVPGVPGRSDAEIHVSRGLTKQLRSRDPVQRKASRRQILWEFARADQDERGTPWVMNKTNTVSRRLNREQARARKVHLRRQRIKRAKPIEPR